MEKEGLEFKNLFQKGSVKWIPDRECKGCGAKGVFFGKDLEHFTFYGCTTCEYCPHCQNIRRIELKVDWEEKSEMEKFLPVMKQKIREKCWKSNDFDWSGSELMPPSACDKCGEISRYNFSKTFEDEESVFDEAYITIMWSVCINCSWKGEYLNDL